MVTAAARAYLDPVLAGGEGDRKSPGDLDVGAREVGRRDVRPFGGSSLAPLPAASIQSSLA